MLNIRRIYKPNPLRSALFDAPPHLTGGSFFYGRIGCLDKDTEVFILENNLVKSIKIKDMLLKSTVLSYNFETNKIEYCYAYKKASGEKECYKITLGSGKTIICSEDHKFFFRDGQEVKAKDLRINDTIIRHDCFVKNRNVWSKKKVIEKIRQQNIKPIIKDVNIYNKIKNLATLGFTAKEISKQLPLLKHHAYCYKICKYHKDTELAALLKNNFKQYISVISMLERMKQDYSYMKGSKIVKIEKIGKRYTYDLIVPNLNNFFLANGILSHNSGKSVGMKAFAERYHDHPFRRYKIIDLWGGERNEQLYWALPSQDITYWDKLKKKFRFNTEGPKQYKVNLLYPMSRKLPDKLPNNPPYVISKIFTIPYKEVLTDDIALVTDGIATTSVYHWKEALNKCKDKEGSPILLKFLRDLGAVNTLLYKSFAQPLVRECLLTDKNNDYNLDMKSELKDQETITVFCFDFIDKEFKLFIMNYILRQIADLLDSGKIRYKTIPLIREASEFFRATDSSVLPDKHKLFRTYLANYIRMGRRGMHPFLDAQSPNETAGLVDGSQDLTILGKLPNESDRLSATNQLRRDNLMTMKQIIDLGQLNPGEYYLAETSKKVRKVYSFLPRSMYWKPEYGNFYNNIWKKLVDKWINLKNDKEIIMNKFIEDEKIAINQEKVEKLIKKEEKKKKPGRKTKEQKKEETIEEIMEIDEINKDNIIKVEDDLQF